MGATAFARANIPCLYLTITEFSPNNCCRQRRRTVTFHPFLVHPAEIVAEDFDLSGRRRKGVVCRIGTGFRQGRSGPDHIDIVWSSGIGQTDIFFFQKLGDRNNYIRIPGCGNHKPFVSGIEFQIKCAYIFICAVKLI